MASSRLFIVSVLAGIFILLGGVGVSAELPAPAGVIVRTPDPPEGSSSLELRWNPVRGAVGYEVYQYRAGRWWFDEQDIARTPLTSSTVITGLDPATTYRFRIKAIGPDGEKSPFSAVVQGTTLEAGAGEAYQGGSADSSRSVLSGSKKVLSGDEVQARLKLPPPDPPNGIIGVFAGSDTVKLSWRQVKGAVRYYVEEFQDDRWRSVAESRGKTYVEISDHPSPGPYKFRIRAVGVNGKSSPPSWPVTVER